MTLLEVKGKRRGGIRTLSASPKISRLARNADQLLVSFEHGWAGFGQLFGQHSNRQPMADEHPFWIPSILGVRFRHSDGEAFARGIIPHDTLYESTNRSRRHDCGVVASQSVSAAEKNGAKRQA